MWQNFVGDVIDRGYDVITFISKYHYLRRPGVASFAEIIKIIARFIKIIFKDSREVKRMQIMCQNPIYICISWYNKMLMSAELRVCVTW